MQGKIEAAKASKSGKTLGVLIGEQWYSTKHWELQGMVGQDITFDTSTSEYNGAFVHWLNDYSPVGSSTTPADQAFDQAHAAAGPSSGPAKAATPTASSVVNLDASIVAQALTKAVNCQTAKEAWACYTYLYRQALNWNPAQEQEDAPFDDSIPF